MTIGKRVNIAGHIGVVIDVEDDVCRIAYERYNAYGATFEHIVAALPEITARDSFDYRPGDRDGNTDGRSSL